MRIKKIYFLLAAPVFLAACEKEKQGCPGATEKEIRLSNFSGITLGETFNVILQKGNTCTIKASGCQNDLEDLALAVNSEGVLDVEYNQYRHNRYRVDLVITLPEINMVNIGGSAKITVDGFAQQTALLNITAAGAAVCDINNAPQEIIFTLGGTAQLDINAASGIRSLKGIVAGTSRVSAYQAITGDVAIVAGGTAKAYVSPVNSLKANASGDSRIYYKGDLTNIEVQQSGSAKVFREF